jgi:hypothetical protein
MVKLHCNHFSRIVTGTFLSEIFTTLNQGYPIYSTFRYEHKVIEHIT